MYTSHKKTIEIDITHLYLCFIFLECLQFLEQCDNQLFLRQVMYAIRKQSSVEMGDVSDFPFRVDICL